MAQGTGIIVPQHVGEAAEIDYGSEPVADFGPPAREPIPLPLMVDGDMRTLVAMDRRLTRRPRPPDLAPQPPIAPPPPQPAPGRPGRPSDRLPPPVARVALPP